MQVSDARDIVAPYCRMSFSEFLKHFEVNSRFTRLKKLSWKRHSDQQRFSWKRIHGIWEKIKADVQADVEILGKPHLPFEEWLASEQTFLDLIREQFCYDAYGGWEEGLIVAKKHLDHCNISLSELRDFSIFVDYNEISVRSELIRIRNVYGSLKAQFNEEEKITIAFSYPNLSGSEHHRKLLHLACAFPIRFSNGERSLDVLGVSGECQNSLLTSLLMTEPDSNWEIDFDIRSREEFVDLLKKKRNLYPELESFPILV